ncbi:hypothetical protein L6164_016641 [Bauhinia variegata]|uniref:Uncharacterized protein n=1 Tax=Bauhinia variegata TaxID=167791 RepID=A0ACB9NRU9_BAUVA|nr:hypothetical protein L6164_016641 [Bauhinia variegata]
MEIRACSILSLLIIASFLSTQAKGESSGSVLLIDSSSNKFFRPKSSSDEAQCPTMLLEDVGAAVSVLLGFTPHSTLSTAGSSKLNEVLVPNPFQRPRAVFLLEVEGINDLKQVQENDVSSSTFRSINILGSDKTDIQLPGDDDVSLVSLDEPLEDFTDKEISEYASLMGGSYVVDPLEQSNGVLSIPLADSAQVSLHMSKKSEREFLVGLCSLIHNVKRAIQMHEDLSQSSLSPAELLTGRFHGIKILQEQYGDESIAQHGVELLHATLTKNFDSLQEAYKGQIVGVVYFYTSTPQDLGKKFDVTFTHHQAARWLMEEKVSNTTIAEVVLVRRTIAWVTGIILIISTLVGIHYLLNMSITRDTLLYSNVKLD